MNRGAICVQAFNKADTVIDTLDSLSRARMCGSFDLIVVQDGLDGNRFRDRYSNEHDATQKAVEGWLAENASAFASAKFIPESLGRGTAGTARVAVNHGFEGHDWVIFSEDDVLFEADALEWFSSLIMHRGFLRENVWAIAGESKYFDSRGGAVSEALVKDALQCARRHRLIARFTYFKWLPSSCFATTIEKWREFEETRGLPRGPKMVNDRCKSEEKFSLWPIIARCRDIGMHHQIGYSMTIHKDPGRIPQKSNYISSGDMPSFSGEFEEFHDRWGIYKKFSSIS